MSQLPQPFNCLLAPHNSLTMFPIWPFPNFSSQGTVYRLSFKILPQKLSTPPPFLSAYHVFWTDRANDIWHLYSLTKLLWQYKCSFQGVLYGICVIKGHWNLWHQLAYKAWERKNWLTIMSCSSFKLELLFACLNWKLALADVHSVCRPSDDWWETNEDENLSRFVTLSATHLTTVSQDFMQPLHTLEKVSWKTMFHSSL
jgi:hypothetical protein